ncbi:MAG: ABC transporter ATP-binding protein/permease [Endomicrobia bacterium]|nr:ABC transporter ATP-binding protein/permease [Endomicrobiia bacterium]MDW8056257.1 ABC transporter ATP-binding protein [Elusimicrobiota bacterium]
MNKIKFLLSYIKDYKSKFVVSVICMLLTAGLTSGSRLLIKPVVDKIFYIKDIKMLSTLVLIIPLVYFLIGLFNYIKNYTNIQIANDIVRRIRLDVFKHLQHISIDYFVMKSSTGHTLARLTNDLNNMFNMLSKTPSVIIADLTTLVGLIFVLFYLSVKFALLSLIVLPLALYPVYFFTKKLRNYSKRMQKEISGLYNNIQESISAIFLIQIFNQQEREIAKFKNFNDKVYTAIKKFARVEYLSSPVMEFIGAIGVAIIILIGGKDVISDKWTPGAFFAFLATVLSFYQPLKRISEINPTIQQGLVSIERITEILEQKSSVEEISTPLDAQFKEKIEFRNVNFSYTRDVEILKNLYFEIKKGERIAIVGPSGAGKSTILNLLLRFYDVQDGEILIDGINIKNFSLKSLRKLFGVVVQETFLFNDTIWYNLTYSNPDATEQEVIEATKNADIYDFIMSLPEKFNTIVGERGYTLSGGERQRLAIARALIKKPEILLFDEPTSALDAESESIVLNAMKKLYFTKTIILITHRLNLVTDFDKIYVFDNGKIVEQGSHMELMLQNGFYSSLVKLQNLHH